MPVDMGGCGYYRVRQPLRMLKQYTVHDTHVINIKEDDMSSVGMALARSDVAIVRQGGEDGMRQLKQFSEFKKVKWVLDIDDNIELISPYSEHYKEYGTEEFFHERMPVWVQGQQGFDVGANKARVDSLLFGMQEADMVTVTTKRLEKYARQYNDTVEIIPNVIDTSQWWRLPLQPNKTLRIGWSGGVSHYEDWHTIREPLNQLLREFKCTLVSVGTHFDGIIDEDNKKQVEVWPWVPFEAHSYRMMCLNLDAAIIPLADLPFNHYKSAVKFYEFSALGIPSVVADVPPYKDDIADVYNAAVYKTPDEFYQKLKWLLINADLRREIGNNANNWVHEYYDAKKATPAIARVFERLTE